MIKSTTLMALAVALSAVLGGAASAQTATGSSPATTPNGSRDGGSGEDNTTVRKPVHRKAAKVKAPKAKATSSNAVSAAASGN